MNVSEGNAKHWVAYSLRKQQRFFSYDDFKKKILFSLKNHENYLKNIHIGRQFILCSVDVRRKMFGKI
jgi:hypothetical protein